MPTRAPLLGDLCALLRVLCVTIICMRRNSISRFLVTELVLLASAVAAAPDFAATATSPAEALPRVIRATLLWTPGDIIDVKTAQAANANFVHTFPRPPKMRGLIPITAQREWLEKWSRQVAALHQAGIFVSASVGSTCFNPEIFRPAGLDPEIYFARDERNQPGSMLGGAYGKELMTSCYSNPHWRDLLQENGLAFARAGFDGIWYDVGGYVDPAVLYCQCEHCREGWRRHVAALGRDASTPLPKRTNEPDFAKWESREFLRWRWAAWRQWSASVREAVQREFPRFAFSHNMGVREGNERGMHMFLQATTNLFDYVHWEEWGHGTAPYSDLTSYLLGAAAGPGKPVMIVQNDKPARNPLQHQIFLAEGYASGGVPEFGTRHSVNSRTLLGFVQRNEDLYFRSRSLATVAVVYSAWSQAIHAYPAKRWPAHWMGQLLLDRHVPFDYVAAERDLNAQALEKYQTLIVPDQGCLSDPQVEAVRAFLQRGGNVVLTGDTAKFDQELRPRATALSETLAGLRLSGPARVTVGRGKLAVFADSPEAEYWRQNPRDFAKTDKLPPPTPLAPAIAETLDWVFAQTLPVEVQAPATTVVLPRLNENRILLHFVNYDVYPDGKELHAARDLRVTLPLPAGVRAANVEIVSPDFDGAQPVTSAHTESGVLRFTVPELKVYSVAVVRLER